MFDYKKAKEAESHLLTLLPKGKKVYATFLGSKNTGKDIYRNYKFFTIVDERLICLDSFLFEAYQVRNNYKEATEATPSHIVIKNQDWKDIVQRIGECLYGDSFAYPILEEQLV